MRKSPGEGRDLDQNREWAGVPETAGEWVGELDPAGEKEAGRDADGALAAARETAAADDPDRRGSELKNKTYQGGIIMPGLNQRGPMNDGPMTGRRMGRCTGAYDQDAPVYGNRGWDGYGRGRGMGCKMGMGWQGCRRPRWGMGMAGDTQPALPSHEALAVKARQLETELAAIKDQLKQMNGV